MAVPSGGALICPRRRDYQSAEDADYHYVNWGPLCAEVCHHEKLTRSGALDGRAEDEV